ncbi:Stp1/IreP family PP2C-type Ser/Thr phosphatase [Virgibacillus oceani]|uniref:protein-serine/threonine phosphatase n=1 Tax=Virgibacillus oceani TaxID=1479511 RepID=A0A917H679_9BACI|nr:Stp1/IreP family PP2C-type Ser/Thr phosphatase [Virgibacillus oceani]GGG69409.1 protein phosphatase [Virgibacillus oceani]
MIGKFLTDRGQIRSHNEDAGGIFFNQDGQFLAIIADGMGGHQAGDVASEMATSVIQKKWIDSNKLHSPEETEEWLTKTVLEMNKTIYDHALQKEECNGMGTTAVIAICTDEFVTTAHIGDSRIYMLNESGFSQVTEDHSLVNELVRSGQITKEDAEHHPRKNLILKALGTEENVAADIQSIGWELGDKLLLCSDGLTNKVSDENLFNFLKLDSDINETAQKMVDLANELGGEDNISLVIVQHDAPKKEGETSC